MNIKDQLNILLSDNNENKINFEVANEREDGTFTVLIREVAAEDKTYVERVLSAHGMVPVPELISSEIASHGGLEYSNHPELVEVAFEDDEEGEGEVGDVEESDEVTSALATAMADIRTEIASIRNTLPKSRAEIALGSIDAVSDDTKLKVIGNPEMMKFANKVFDMISPGEDKSNYAAFLYNFDDFLLMHQPDNKYNIDDEKEDEDEEETTSSISESASFKPVEIANFVKLFGDINTASAFLNDFNQFLPAEIAKGKNARSALLSAMMKGMSGEAGLAAVAAWEAGDAVGLRSALEQVIAGVVAKVSNGD